MHDMFQHFKVLNPVAYSLNIYMNVINQPRYSDPYPNLYMEMLNSNIASDKAALAIRRFNVGKAYDSGGIFH